jgi:hypothetical protein
MVEHARANAGAIALGALLSSLAAAAVGLIGLAAVKGRVRALPLAALLFLVVGADLFINARRFFIWSPPQSRLYADDDVTRRLRAVPMPYRALDLPDRNGVYPTAFLMEKGIPNAIGHHGNELNAYDQLLGGKNIWANLASERLWNLLALRFVIFAVPLQLPRYHLVAHVMGPTGGSLEAVLYEADSTPPYARLVPAAVKVPEDQIVPTLLDTRLDYSRLLLLPSDAPVELPHLDSLPAPMTGRASVAAWEPGAIAVRLDPPPEHDAWLLVSENWYPDWHASVDDRTVQVLRGQKTFLTVQVRRGSREVRFWFASAAYGRGKAITLASFVLIALAIALPPALRGRRG